jgi:pyruvate,orthophosphate dikinase
MEAQRPFESSALRVNLERTRSQRSDLPASHAALLDAASAQYGVAKRLRTFLEEYHHRYPDFPWLAAQLRSIALQDFWFYETLDEASTHLLVFIEIMSDLLERAPSAGDRRRVLQTLLEFIEHCAASEHAGAHASVLEAALAAVEQRLEADRDLRVQSSSMQRSIFRATAAADAIRARVNTLLKRALASAIDSWREDAHIDHIIDTHESLLGDRAADLRTFLGRSWFDAQRKQLDAATTWEEMRSIPDDRDIAERFRQGGDIFPTPVRRAYYISAILPLPGLAHLNEHLLWDLNSALRSIHEQHGREEMSGFLDDMFRILHAMRYAHMNTVLECLQTLGEVVLTTDDASLIDRFIDALIDFGFVHPELRGVDDEWQPDVEKNHVKNIRVWLALIEHNPRCSARLLSALIIHLRLGGVFVADNDLFQRDVTTLLNADIRSLHFLIKQLAILFPVYFNEIGAEGELRDISTVIDQLSGRQDRLIHFLRKQIHAESNNSHVRLTEDILRAWHSGDVSTLQAALPADVRMAVSPEEEWFRGAQAVMRHLSARLRRDPVALAAQPSGALADAAADAYPVDDVHLQRVLHLCRIHQLLREKYSIAVEDIIPHMEKLHVIREADIDRFRELRAADQPDNLLSFVLDMLTRLHETFLSDEVSTAQEEIYYKRHIAAGIPSMYGRYMETKFQSLGLVFRFEALATRLFERLIEDTNLRYITAGTLRRIHRILALFRRSLDIEGYSDEGFSSTVEMLRFSLSTTSFTIHQYINLFQFLAGNVKSIIHSNFIAPHEAQIERIVPQYLARADGLASGAVDRSRVHGETEKLYRDLISSTFPIQQLDAFIAAVSASMSEMLKYLSSDVIQSVMGYESRLTTTRLFEPNRELDNPVFLGAKGYYLKRLYALGFPVPPGFVLTTELFRRRDAITRHPDMRAEIDDIIRTRLRSLEDVSRARYGNPARPLLLSVRSGAAISIPGAMNTFLNVGMNRRLVEEISGDAQQAWTAWDCYRRFLQNWGMSHGIPRDDFDAVMIAHKEQSGVEQKVQFAAAQMRAIAEEYRAVLHGAGVSLEEDLFQQLVQAVLSVLDSWYTERARVYRRKLQIAEDWGTAVVVQKMVLGNRNSASGSGVLFTRDPFARESGVSLYGDFTVCSQGEDIVAGLVHTLPVSERQRQRAQSPTSQSLEKNFPAVFSALEQHSRAIVQEHSFGHQEIEFTFETSSAEGVYILQSRDHSPVQDKKTAVFDFTAGEAEKVGSGIGIGGGAMNGLVCFDMEDLDRLRREHPDADLVLVRPDTVPDDIGMIFECDGLLTARGGATSHAAVTAVRLQKTCVVDCRALRVDEAAKSCVINGIAFAPGDAIAIDGRLGSIYRGRLAVSYEHIQMP